MPANSVTVHTPSVTEKSATTPTSTTSVTSASSATSARSVIANFIDDQAARDIYLDSVQQEAVQALAAGRDVLLSAPTGSGKTMIALGAVELAFAQSVRCVYTAPIKALSNQKYAQLRERYGSEHIGLLTGDESINRDAQILVVTTEVLRNMLYARDASIADIGYVILDEVHYLADPTRGPVWEEIILQLPDSSRLVSLSATISNVDELGEWLTSVRGDTAVIVSHDRPVPLVQYVYSAGNLLPLFDKNGKISGKAADAIRHAGRDEEGAMGAMAGRFRDGGEGSGRGARAGGEARGGARRRYERYRRRQGVHFEDRRNVLMALHKADMLPAIEFIFSRKGCDRAVGDLLDSEVHFTNGAQKARIDQALQELRAQLSDDDARTIRFNFWAKALRRGFGAHHAGMFPALKELTEQLMNEGLLALVYATGTLALGIDMPVRSVIVESMRRFDGADFVELSGTEYTQLIGRAGRRGKDSVGNAVILATPELMLKHLETVSSGALEPLKSAFFPSYNAVAHLLRTSTYLDARTMMGTSFAQFQSNRELVRLEARSRRIRDRIAQIERTLEGACDSGDIVEYARLRDKAGRASKAERKRAKAAYKEAIVHSWNCAEVGRAYAYAYQGNLHYGVVVAAHKERLRLADEQGELRWISLRDLTSELRDVGEVLLPFGMKIRDPRVREQIADELFELTAERIELGSDRDLAGSWDRAAAPKDPALAAHSVNSCPDLPAHLRQTRELITLDQQLRSLKTQIHAAGDSVAREFDATARILDHIGYMHNVPSPEQVSSADVHIKLSAGAYLLCGIHNESDLLITQCLNEASFEALSAEEFAGICTCFLGDRRLAEGARYLGGRLGEAWASIQRNYDYLRDLERRYKIDRTPEPNNGGVEAFTAWAAGAPLSSILRIHRLDVGDFMNTHRRLADVLRQISVVAADSYAGEIAASALKKIQRWEWL